MVVAVQLSGQHLGMLGQQIQIERIEVGTEPRKSMLVALNVELVKPLKFPRRNMSEKKNLRGEVA